MTIAVEARKSKEASDVDEWFNRTRGAVIIAGAGARGAYEAGVLAELLPALFPNGLDDVVLLGTSAGAVNAALWAQYAERGKSLREVGDKVCDFWRNLGVEHVYDPIPVSLVKRALPFVFGGISSVLDTAPLARRAKQTLNKKQLAKNIADGSIGGVGLVATTCPVDGTGGRSHVFLQASPKLKRPEPDPTSALDYLDVTLTHEHVLASAAIPVAFPAVRVPQPGNGKGKGKGKGYYTDGGVRLNTPIAPALDLGAERLVVVSSHATKYPTGGGFDEKPDVVDIAAQSVHSILADGMIEDLRSLRRINSMVKQSQTPLINTGARPPRPYKFIPIVDVAPEPGQLAQLARDFRSKFTFSPIRNYRKLEYAFIRKLFAGFGRGVGNDELLSYLLFNSEFADLQIELGRTRARAVLQDRLAVKPAPASASRAHH